MRITNKTGNAQDTILADDEGKSLMEVLPTSRIIINADAGIVKAVVYCEKANIDMKVDDVHLKLGLGGSYLNDLNTDELKKLEKKIGAIILNRHLSEDVV